MKKSFLKAVCALALFLVATPLMAQDKNFAGHHASAPAIHSSSVPRTAASSYHPAPTVSRSTTAVSAPTQRQYIQPRSYTAYSPPRQTAPSRAIVYQPSAQSYNYAGRGAVITGTNKAGESTSRNHMATVSRSYNIHDGGYHRGMRVARLPEGFHCFYWCNQTYYFSGGIYYQALPDTSYVVVDSPFDSAPVYDNSAYAPGVVSQLPSDAVSVTLSDPNQGFVVYYYTSGLFYQQTGEGYQIVPAPLGITVAGIPQGSLYYQMNGQAYYEFGGNFFSPIMTNSGLSYMTVMRPA
jgi:hypothetical protein